MRVGLQQRGHLSQGRIVELDEKLVLSERFLINALGASDVVNREVVLGGQLVQVKLGSVDELLMAAAAALRQRNNAFRSLATLHSVSIIAAGRLDLRE